MPPYAKWMKVKPGRYANMTLTLTDQNLNSVLANDTNILITLILKLGNADQTTQLINMLQNK